jgi:hypothetical protein
VRASALASPEARHAKLHFVVGQGTFSARPPGAYHEGVVAFARPSCLRVPPSPGSAAVLAEPPLHSSLIVVTEDLTVEAAVFWDPDEAPAGGASQLASLVTRLT